jgi:mannose-6-phosphate isomerase-like protein (cupin superfamily)
MRMRETYYTPEQLAQLEARREEVGGVTEIFLVASGSALARVGLVDVNLLPGDLLIVEPGEPHTLLHSSDDYLHFVVHAPGLPAEEARAERSSVSRTDLGL